MATEGYHDIRQHTRVSLPLAGRNASADATEADQLQLVTGEAASLDLSRSIAPSAVIDELRLAVDVCSTRNGVRLIAEVVLPHAPDRRSGAPLRALVFGPSYSTPGNWERLEFTGLPLQLQRSVRGLQLSTSETIDARGAYVDRVRIRVRPGRGEATLQFGMIHVAGGVPVDPADGRPTQRVDHRVQLASGELSAESRPHLARENPPRVELVGGQLHVDGKPLFPRAIEDLGDSLRDAHSLGCNIVILPAVPTRAQEREAEAAGLWLIAPPPDPEALGRAGQMPAYPRVVAWQLGRRLTALDVDAARHWASLVRRFDPAQNRPLIASVSHDHRALSRILDVVVIECQPFGGALPLERYLERLDAERRLVLPGKTVWVRIQTQLPPEVIHQARCLLPAQAATVNPTLPADEVSRLTCAAVAHGARGLVFAAPPNRIPQGEYGALRAELRLINHQLDLLDPLLASTGTTRRVASLAPGVQAGVLSNGRTHCVLPWNRDEAGMNLGPAASGAGPSASQMSFVVPGVAEPSDAYLLATTGATRLKATREAGGVRITVGSLLPRDIVLLTQDALAAQRMRAAASEHARQMAEYERELISPEGPASGAATTEPERLRDLRLVAAQSRRAANPASTADQSYRSSPLERLPELSVFDQSLRLLDRRALASPNLLPGGDFEGLEATRQAGWRHVQLVHQESPHDVELVGKDAHSGAFCLRIRSGTGAEAAAHVMPGAWLESPPIPLHAGDVLRVSGWVRGTGLPDASASPWAIIDDSLGGEPLSLNLIPTTQWQPFVLYRATDAHHQWALRLACAGMGEVYFDGLAVQRVPREVLVDRGGDW